MSNHDFTHRRVTYSASMSPDDFRALNELSYGSGVTRSEYLASLVAREWQKKLAAEAAAKPKKKGKVT